MEGNNILEENIDISKLKVQDLKRELKLRGFTTTGNKSDLMERLQSALKTKSDDPVGGESVDDLDDDFLNYDDDEHLDGSESGITDLDSTIDVPATQKHNKRKSTESQPDQSKQIKKVVLNRLSNSENILNNGEHVKDNSDVKMEKKVIKLSELSAKERLEMRAKKFGVPVTVDAKRAARAERFGTTFPSKNKTAPIGTASSNVDVLEQRAKRFGTTVSSFMTKINNEEKLQKRKERFGIVTLTNGSSQSEKAKQRLERFKQPVQ